MTEPTAALGTEGKYFSVVSWKSKGDDLWLYHKASGNKKANLYELALVGEIEALRAERIAPALGTAEGEVLERLRSWHRNCLVAQRGRALHPESWGILASILHDALEAFTPLSERAASQARTIAALRAQCIEIATECGHSAGLEYGGITAQRIVERIRALKEHPNG